MAFLPASGAQASKNVLILNSYHQGFKWTDDITRGALSALDPLKDHTRIFIQYMNTKWVKDDLYFQQLRDIYGHEFARTRFDLIIASDNDAFNFLRRYRDEVFGKVPVVFCGVNYLKKEDLSGTTLFTGTSETADLRESLEVALRLRPSTRKIFIINDKGISGSIVRNELTSLQPAFRGKADFIFEDSTDLEKILKDVEGLSQDTLIFYTFFYGDPARKTYENDDCISEISRRARVPIFGSWDFNLGYGMVGGKLTSGYDQGAAAGRMGVKVLDGERVEEIPPILRSPGRYMFDYGQMTRFGIKKSALPMDSEVVNGPATFRKVPVTVIWAVICGIALLSLVSLLLLKINRQRKRSEELLQKAHDELEMTVFERTRDLSGLNERLRGDIEARRVIEEELKQTNLDLTREVGARKAAEENALQSVSLLRATIESTNDGILVVDANGEIVDWNRRFLEMWRIPESLMSSREDDKALAYVLDQLANPEEFIAKIRELYSQPDAESLDILKFKDERIFERYSRPQHLNDAIVGRVWSFRDITDRKKMEEEVMKAQKLESLGVLAGGIAHDFNNLLTGIMGNISMAKAYANPAEKAYARIVEAEKACSQTRGLTRQLLTFAKGGAPVRKVESISQIIMDSAGFALRGSNVRCTYNLPDDLWNVEVDSGQMGQVINNLIINAAQAMPDGGVISVSAGNAAIGKEDNLPISNGRYVHILIKDQGAGIQEDILPKIFDPYFTTKKKGSGLGLASVYSIIMKHDGHITVASKPGEGATFHFYLPASENNCPAEAEQPEPTTPRRGKGRILVMDDERQVSQTAREILNHLGYSADICTDGAAALNLYREALASGTPYSVVFMDLTIPGGMGGKIAMVKLLEIDPGAKGVVMSGYSNDPILANFRDYGFRGVVVKPFTADEIMKTINSLGK
jgi:signal transduction histidine kinase/ActR/RegA family two-component response regulator